MKDKIESVITKRLRYLRQKDKEAVSSDILQLMNSYSIKSESLKKEKSLLEDEVKSLKNEFNLIKKENKNLKNKVRFLSNELNAKFEKKESQTIAFQLGESLIESIKNPKVGIKKLPTTTTYLVKESIIRRSKKKSASKLDRILGVLLEDIHVSSLEKINQDSKYIQGTVVKKSETERKYIDIKNNFSRISYDYSRDLWPKKVKSTRFISVLDEISESSWSEEFGLFRLARNNFVKQVAASTANGLFLESCWNGNNGEWLYAFTSPELKHKNAQDLLKAIDVAKSKGLPILFWNKEDPMHYEKFLPIAEKCDIVFTTDANKVDDYKKDLNNNNVYTLPFAANPYICNPMNRSRYEEESICFAGSYYSVGHDARKQQMDDVLPALLNLDGIIYDRMSKLNNERYYFPEKYQNIIRDSVNFKEMTALYKHFKLFLNVNTITDSPSMMSRRVYELLACGTPVISTPSKALEEQFPNIVQIAESAEEVERIAKRLLTHPKEYEKLSHLGYREVMLKHTYEDRKDVICKSLSIPNRNQQPLVSVILCTCRSYLIDRIVENLTRQNYQNIEVIFVLQDFNSTEVSMLLDKVKASSIKRVEVIELNSKDISLGERFNTAAKIAKGEYIAKIDDDDFYFENYLKDMLIPFSFGDFALVGKREVFMYLEGQNKLIRRYPKQRHQTVEFVAGPTFVVKKSVFDQVEFEQRNTGEDSSFIKNIIIKGYKVYSSDPFNFVQFRASNSDHHTWKVTDNELLNGKQTEVVCEGLDDSFYRF